MTASPAPPELPAKPHRKFPWVIYLVVLFLILAVSAAPIGSVIACSAIANAYGCQVDEGSVHPCVIGGQDRGELLYTMFVSGWFMLLTIPVGALAFVVWLIVLILHREKWRARRAADP